MKRLLPVLLLLSSILCPFSSAHAAHVQEVVTPGGFTVWLIEEHALPLIAVKVAFTGAGYAHDPAGREGRAHVTAAMLLEGAGDMDSREFSEALEMAAIDLTSSVDSDDFLVSLEALSEHKEKAFAYLGLAIAQPRFDSGALERVRGQTRTILTQQQQQPAYKLQRAWQKLAFGDHPYARPLLGTQDGIEALDGNDLGDFAESHLTRGNIVIAAVGDIAPAELAALIDRHFAALPEKYEPDVEVPEFAVEGGKEPAMVEFDIPQTLVAFGAPGLKRSDPDYFSAYVMNHILGGGGSLVARLGEEIREKRGLAYSVYSYLHPMAKSAVWQGGFATRNEQVAFARDTLAATLKNFVENGPTEQEVRDAKQFITGSFVLSLGSNADLASFLISMQINKLGRDYLERRNFMVETVTRESVHAMARRLIDPDRLLVAMVGKPPAAGKE